MTERDVVDHWLELATRGLLPSAADKARHRAALGIRPETPRGSARQGAAAVSAPRGVAALRTSGAAGLTAGASILAAGVVLGFWLRGAVDERGVGEREAALQKTASLAASDPAAAPPAPISMPPVSMPPAPVERADQGAVSPPASPDDDLPRPTRAVEPRRAGGVTKPTRRAPQSRDSNARRPSGTEPVVAQPFDDELALLQRVERALRTNNASLAMALLGELDERFIDTRLGEERSAARHIAECRLRLPDAPESAQRFLSDRPSSVYAERVRAACARADEESSAPEKARAPADTPGR